MRKFLSIGVTICVCLLSLAGCSKGDASKASAPDANAIGKNASGNLAVWAWNFECGNFGGETDPTKAAQKYQQYFKTLYPKINPTFTMITNSDYYVKLKVAMAASNGPDVFAMAPGSYIQPFKPFLKPLDDYAVRDWGSNWRDKFVSGSMTQIDTLGKQCLALPACLTYSGTVFYSNKILNANGLKAPTTWADLESTAKALRAKNQLPLVMGSKDNWVNEDMFMTLAGQINADKLYSAIEGKTKWTDPDIVKALSYFQKLFSNKIVQDGALGENMYMEAYSLWTDTNGNCKAAMQPNGSWHLKDFSSENQVYKNFSSWDRDVMLFPSIEGHEGKLLVAPDILWCMSKDTKNPEAAWSFIKWSESEEGQQNTVDSFSGYPAWKNIQPKGQMSPELTTVYNRYKKWIDEGKVSGYRNMAYTDLTKSLDENLQLLATAKVTPEQAGASLEKASQAQKR